MKKTAFFWCFLLFLVIGIAFRVTVFAGAGENARGWLWGGSDDGVGNSTGLGWVSMNNLTGGGSKSYGISIPSAGGAVTGYGWSENIGWIQFDPDNDGSMPPGCSSGVTLSGNALSGCARVVGIAQEKLLGNSGGWDGWIKMSGGNYGVTLSGNVLSGYAWSGEFGWVDFSRVTVVVSPSLTLHYDSCSGVEVPSGFNMLKGQSKVVVACDENGANVTSLATWSEYGGAPATTISITGSGNTRTVNADTAGMESFKAKNGTLEDAATVTVVDCTPQPCIAANICQGTVCDPGCSLPPVPGNKNCRKHWIEVAP